MTKTSITSQRKIGGISLLNTGLKGIVITYETIEIIDGVSSISEDTKKSYRPVHRELKDLVKKLTDHLSLLCGYSKSLLDGIDDGIDPEFFNRFEVTGIKAGTESFLISGKIKSWENKIISINTPLIKEHDEYEGYAEVMKLVDDIYFETAQYLEGVKKPTRKEIITDYMVDIKKESFDYDVDWDNLTDEAKEELEKEITKSTGISVREVDGKNVIVAEEDDNQLSLDIKEVEGLIEDSCDGDYEGVVGVKVKDDNSGISVELPCKEFESDDKIKEAINVIKEVKRGRKKKDPIDFNGELVNSLNEKVMTPKDIAIKIEGDYDFTNEKLEFKSTKKATELEQLGFNKAKSAKIEGDSELNLDDVSFQLEDDSSIYDGVDEPAKDDEGEIF